MDSARLDNAGTSKARHGNLLMSFDQTAAPQCKVSRLNLYPFLDHLHELIHCDQMNDVARLRNGFYNIGRPKKKSNMLTDN